MKRVLFFGEVKPCACGKGFTANVSGEIDGEIFDASGNGDTTTEAIKTALLTISYLNSK